MEVGANDGQSWSNTWHLAEMGWRGLYYEPVRTLADKCRQRHVDNNVTVIQKAVGSTNGKTKLYLGESASTLDYVARNDTFGYGNNPENFIWVDCVTLNASLAEQNIPHDFDLLVIDVDGDEVGVLRGLNLDTWRPGMIIIETCKRHPNESWRFNVRGIEARLNVYYTEIYQDHINSIYVRKDAEVVSLFQSKISTILKIGGWYSCTEFVETGTGAGDTLDQVFPYFNHCWSVELNAEYVGHARERFEDAPSITLLQGDSGEKMAEILPQLKGVPLFFLDAHYCGGYSAMGSKETPILAELETILKNVPNAVILVDDFKSFLSNANYPKPDDVKKFVLSIRPKGVFEILAEGGGMFLILPTKRKPVADRELKQVSSRVVRQAWIKPAVSQAEKKEERSFERAPILYGPYR